MHINSTVPMLMRKAKILNTTELALLTGIEIGKLYPFITSRVKVDLEIAEQLADFFGCRLKDLIRIEEEHHNYSFHLKKGEEGIVYFLKAENGLTKVGWTQNLAERKKTLERKEKTKTELVHYISSQDCVTLEQVIHTVFSKKRVRGEWFDLNDEDVQMFKNKEENK